MAAALAFFGGIALIAVINRLVPDYKNPHELHTVEEMAKPDLQNHQHDKRLMRTGVFTALVLAIHNFPEGIATFMFGLQDISTGVPAAFAVALHNIPEGIAVSVRYFTPQETEKKLLNYLFFRGLPNLWAP